MAQREASVMSKNWQESRSSDITRNKQELSQSPMRAARGLLEEIDRDGEVGVVRDVSALAMDLHVTNCAQCSLSLELLS